jgi:hypothetical protein
MKLRHMYTVISTAPHPSGGGQSGREGIPQAGIPGQFRSESIYSTNADRGKSMVR